MCEIAQETLEEEKKSLSSTVQKNAKSALTELFLEMKTDKTPKIIDRIVSDIDDIVKIKVLKANERKILTVQIRKIFN